MESLHTFTVAGASGLFLHFLIGNLFINFVRVHLLHFSDMGTNVKDLFLNCSYLSETFFYNGTILLCIASLDSWVREMSC
jgi:hypothetical protein